MLADKVCTLCVAICQLAAISVFEAEDHPFLQTDREGAKRRQEPDQAPGQIYCHSFQKWCTGP